MKNIIIKNNHMNKTTLRKMKYFYFIPIYKYILAFALILSFISACVYLFHQQYIRSMTYLGVFIFICVMCYIQAEFNVKRLLKLQKEKYHSDDIIFDLKFNETGVISIYCTNQKESIMEYQDIKNIVEMNDIVLLRSKAGYTTFFEKKNINYRDLDTLKQLFLQKNIKWENPIMEVF